MSLRSAASVLGFLALVSCSDDEAEEKSSSVSSTSSSSGSAASSGSGGDGATGGSGDGGAGALGGGGGGPTGCVDPVVLATLQEHLDSLVATAQVMAAHPGPFEATGFLLAPGLPSPPAVSNVFAGPLITECATPMSYDPFCEAEGRCSQIECTGRGAGWIMHHWVEPAPFTSGRWSFEEVRADTHWDDGASGVTFELEVAATGQGKDWSMTGTGQMDLELMEVSEQYPGLFEAGEAEVTLSSSPEATTGAVVIEGVTVAATDAQGQLQATGDCPGS